MEIIKMPKLGESVHEGTIEEWLVNVGDTVSEYDPLCEVLTDKVTAEVPSLFDGVINEILVERGETVSVGTPILKIEVEGDGSSAEEPVEELQERVIEDKKKNVSVSTNTKFKSTFVEKPSGMRISPVVMRLASENNIDLNEVKGTGALERVTKKDIEKFIASGGKNKNKVETPVKENKHESIHVQTPPTTNNSTSLKGTRIPVSGVRKAIANKMTQSVTEIPHAWLMMEVDATNLVALRNKHKENYKNQGVNLTYFTFFIDAVTKALAEYPILNSTWQDEEILVHDDINISIAVASDDNLYVPVIKGADRLSIKGLAEEVGTLATLGRSNKLTQSHMSGGTFTVNNTGAFGSIQSMGIINHPQAAILQVESIIKKPVFINDMLAARHMVNLCMSIDHRILDGLVAGKFLARVKELIENIDPNQSNL
ncbi:dihydrolipoamide acetyltransferase family protein [Phocicoccus pinnipedialis]|uniref:Dihydrolipoamide acetyltransferase component of pyruvate dehydrogenase complex n=1 Tax=Phocicoccus pinnipedialis TaxID=110845 RepID=A0A6V7RE64_9BACL|nr:dihydrolipoamide acetyltransferase family protein [Jeotgalicoccus pinnipedialis]MBP1939332.1 2-oxoisovalerate dehydrogenase E2 component (dihydrolipoyl transacylase) [Jeotgalicoccus pinnipedialis]CAD2075829.1 Dihydrolipoyllysine-residue succinyltransferase component of 2-oxoglutarate dehydrogenase complex [Jeotgalicoccus pinnipedialis]